MAEATERWREQPHCLALAATADDLDGDRTSSETKRIARRQRSKLPGDDRLWKLRSSLACIDNVWQERSNHQIEFHDAFTRVCGRILYGKDWNRAEHDMKLSNGWKSSPAAFLVSTPRRFGKTFSVAMFAAALAISVPCAIGIFSPGKRQSCAMLSRVVQFLGYLGVPLMTQSRERRGSCLRSDRRQPRRRLQDHVVPFKSLGAPPLPSQSHARRDTGRWSR